MVVTVKLGTEVAAIETAVKTETGVVGVITIVDVGGRRGALERWLLEIELMLLQLLVLLLLMLLLLVLVKTLLRCR